MPSNFIVDQEFSPIKESVRPDNRGRVTLGQIAVSKMYKVMVNKFGQILLDPVVNVPEREAWLLQNPEAMRSLQRGLEQSAEGDVHFLGSFEEYADLELEEEA